MVSKKNTVRFAVGSPTGPQGAVWRLWADVRKGDIYIGSRWISDKFKASLHASGQWRVGHSEAEAERLGFAENTDRAVVKWSAPRELKPGVQLAFLVFVPASEAVSPPSQASLDPSIYWHPTPPPDMRAVFSVWIADPAVKVLGTMVGNVNIPGKNVWCSVKNEGDGPAAQADRELDRQKLLAHLGTRFLEAQPRAVRAVVVGEITGGPMCFVDLVLR